MPSTGKSSFFSQLVFDQADSSQDWGLVCAIIEVVIEVLVILIYAVVFYRFYTKRRLAKSMDRRDKARSDLYLAQLRLQSAPNTPGFGNMPKSPFVSVQSTQDSYSAAENGEIYSTQFATPQSPTKPQPTFQLQPPPIRVQQATPKTEQGEFSAPASAQNINEHMTAAPGERTYEAVPIPEAYTKPHESQLPSECSPLINNIDWANKKRERKKEKERHVILRTVRYAAGVARS